MADKRVHERKLETNGKFIYHERLVPKIAVCFKADVRLSSFNDAGAATQEMLGHEHPDHFPGGATVLALNVSGDDEDDWYFKDMK